MLNKSWKSLFAIILILNLFAFGWANNTVSNDATKNIKAAEFVLKDQFNNELTYKFPKNKPSILAIADKDGSEQLEAWLRPIIEKYDEQLDVQGVAELSSVPGIAKGIVRNAIKKRSKRAIMLDWSGDVAKSYKFQKDNANIFLIDKQGNIVAKQIGAADEQRLEQLYREIEALLK